MDAHPNSRVGRVPHPWAMLAVAVLAQASVTVVLSTPAFLIPLLHTVRHLSLVEAGLLAASPNLGMVLASVAWGAAADRWGERKVLITGPLVTAVFVALAMIAPGYVPLGLAFVGVGLGAASVSAASGRLVVGWFPRERRGLAMGIRQTCQPLGVAVAALVVPPLVAAGTLQPALVFGAALLLVSAAGCAILVIDPPRQRVPAEGARDKPYRTGVLWRIHAVSMLLVVPQFALSTFGLVWFVVGFGWSTLAAGIVVATSQLLGALGRIGVGLLSDRVGSRLRPLRWIAIAGIGALLATGASGALQWNLAAAISFVLASCISVADNGLTFTSVAEFAGPHWSGRALGAQNTGQFIGAAAVGPVVGALIGLVGYPAAFALVAIAPVIATPLIPSARLEHERDSPAVPLGRRGVEPGARHVAGQRLGDIRGGSQ